MDTVLDEIMIALNRMFTVSDFLVFLQRLTSVSSADIGLIFPSHCYELDVWEL